MSEIGLHDERTKRLIAMGEMAASLAHEIRNPLGSMELFCSLLKKDLSTQPELLYLAEQIHKGIKTLDQVISNSLQFVRDSQPHRKPVANIKALLEEVVAAVKPRAESANTTLQVTNSVSEPLNIDAFQINQALLNLILNAIDAVELARRSRGSVTINSELDTDGKWLLTVSDNGIGIDEADQQRMFDPFFTRKEKGTGLGLSIVYSIVVAHGGQVTVNSEIGKGTTLTLEIPALGEGE